LPGARHPRGLDPGPDRGGVGPAVVVPPGPGHRRVRAPGLQPARRAGGPLPAVGPDAQPPGMTARWRSLLFVPGNRPDVAAKAPRSGPHAVVLDLEDAVPPAAKAGARDQVREAAAGLAGTLPLCVRVNPPGTEWFARDVAALPDGLAAVVVPKLESAAQVAEMAGALGGRPVVAGLETV